MPRAKLPLPSGKARLTRVRRLARRCLSGSVRTVTQLQVQMTTVDRVIKFSATPPEEDAREEEPDKQALQARAARAQGGEESRQGRDSATGTPTRSWPQHGRIQWNGVVCCYERGAGQAALDDVLLTVEGEAPALPWHVCVHACVRALTWVVACAKLGRKR